MRNIELKAHVDSARAAWILYELTPLADRGPMTSVHEDIFFACPNGRLKLRIFSDNHEGELIFYQRADVSVPKVSEYVITPTSRPDLLCETLTRAYGQAGKVKKRRTLLTLGVSSKSKLSCLKVRLPNRGR